MQRVSRQPCLWLLCVLCAAGATATRADDASNALPESRFAALDPVRMPLAFEANRGQFDKRVRFVARGRNQTAFITDAGLVLTRERGGGMPHSWRDASAEASAEPREGVALHLKFLGARGRATSEGADLLPGRSNYFIGNKPKSWHTDVPHYARVVRREAYPGIDVAYYQGRNGIEYDLIVRRARIPRRCAWRSKAPIGSNWRPTVTWYCTPRSAKSASTSRSCTRASATHPNRSTATIG
jgi:hypothetical protein